YQDLAKAAPTSSWAKWKYLLGQFRPRPSPDQVDNHNVWAYSLPSWHDAYAGSSTLGLHESEVLLCDRYFRPGQALLDIGCGAGREAFGFARRDLQVTGIDVCPKLIADAKTAAGQSLNGRAPNFCVGSPTRLDFPPASFDAIYLASDIYTGVPGRRNRVKALARCRHIVRPGGWVIFPVKLSPPDSVRIHLVMEVPRTAVRWLIPGLVPNAGIAGNRRETTRIGECFSAIRSSTKRRLCPKLRARVFASSSAHLTSSSPNRPGLLRRTALRWQFPRGE